MATVLTGFFDRKTAEALADKASNSDHLGYPACSHFEERGQDDLWRIDIYPQQSHSLDVLLRELGPVANELTESALPDDLDWILEGLKDLKPVAVGRFFVHGSHDHDQVRVHHHAIRIDANQAFGTGHHGTTAGCLEAIEAVTKRHRFKGILDLGTGSGVLAAALALETRQPILATDIDPIAVQIAHQNMKDNGIGPLVTCAAAVGFHHPVFKEKGPFGLIVANILAGPLKALAKSLCDHLSSNGTIILSGLLIHQQASVLAAYRAQGAFLERAIHRDGWATLILTRP